MPEYTSKMVNDWGQHSTTFINDNPNGKIRLTEQPTFTTHRSGWNYAIHSIASLHNNNGVDFYGFLENEFCWNYEEYKKKGLIPFKKPWVGFLHNPQNQRWWFGTQTLPLLMMEKPEFQQSMKYCKGLFALSEYHANFLRTYLNVKVDTFIHPTETPENIFSIDKFINNDNKRILNIGYWQRRLHSLNFLPVTKDQYIKTKVLPYKKDSNPHKFIQNLQNLEIQQEPDIKHYKEKYHKKEFDYVEHGFGFSNSEYDNLLSENIVFLDLYDSSANNAVIECIARGTPLLVNNHPAVVEYLGHDYPFYFSNYDEAAQKLCDIATIIRAHKYLLNCRSNIEIDGSYFLSAFENSEVYRSL
tara:strand:- start:1048 stop:2118 length:1071 start_codon:yes stop_codon:yes gene_type:complete